MKLFISYRREDSEHIAGRVYDRLAAQYGKDAVFMDVDAIPFGVDFVEHLSNAVGECDVLLAIIGDDWLDVCHKGGQRQGQRRLDDPNDFVRIEIEAALQRNIPVIPVLVEKATMPQQDQLPTELNSLSRRNAAEVRSGRDFHDHMDRLIRGIDYLLKPSPSKPERKPGDIITNSLGMKFAWIPPGTFLMGSPKSEEGREPYQGADEFQHKVTLTRGFYMGIYPVTRGQFAAFVQKAGFKTQAEREGGAHVWTGKEWKLDSATNWKTPGFEQTNDHPVTSVSWNDSITFAEWLAQHDKMQIRLPSEAEWEFACRAGTTSPFYFGETISTDQANYDGNYTCGKGIKGKFRQQTTPVGSFPANTWGLFDMHGNILEWCQDWFGEYPRNDVVDPQGSESGQYHVLRGGSWANYPVDCRSAYRVRSEPGFRRSRFGLRVCFCLD